MISFLEYCTLREQYSPIRGEYWIRDGYAEFADGNVGDFNHEGIAEQAVFSENIENIIELAKELNINTSQFDNDYFDIIDTDAVSNLVGQISEVIDQDTILQRLGVNQDIFSVLEGGGDASYCVMKYGGWIALRGTDIELFGYNERKRQSLLNGLEDIISYDLEDMPAEDVEFTMYDHQTNRSSNLTLADIENPIVSFRSNQPLQSKGHSKFNIQNQDSEENKYSKPTKSIQSPMNVAAKQQGMIGPGQNWWRGTSEGVL
ncbi:MAG: hypothetical protein DWQ19_09830 [Crenarchaeota archaeon]|nr:MAG: hypothetical protein DWQ19_09830 [Thermoproteota archaeon]